MKNVFLFLLGTFFLFQSCSSSDDSDDGGTPPVISNAVKLANDANLGTILTDAVFIFSLEIQKKLQNVQLVV